jgi:ATP-dependent Clp protease ATP-binding subunit ClpA
MPKFTKNFLNFFKNFYSQSFISPFLEKKTDIVTPIVFSDHIDSTKTIEQKIQLERRRRHQAYTALDYHLSLTTYFDFFSFDTFQIAKEAKYLTQIEKGKVVTSDILLLAFFSKHLKIAEILHTFGMTKENILEKVSSFSNEEDNIIENWIKKFQISFPISFQSIIVDSEIEYSLEVNRIFQKAAENAFERFKTPLIGTEILFLTLLEEEETLAGKIIKEFFPSDFEWFSLRYELIKRIYNQESMIRTEVGSSQEYFAYLLKTRFSDFEFESLISNGYFSQSVLSFRNQLISEALKIDIYKCLENEVYESMKLNRKKNSNVNRFNEILEPEISNRVEEEK